MSTYTRRKASFKTCDDFGRIRIIEVNLYEKEKTFFYKLGYPNGTFWIESSEGYKSPLFRTRKKADYEFERKCLEYYVWNELGDGPDSVGKDERNKLHPLFGFSKRVHFFNYFIPETKDFLFSCFIIEGSYVDSRFFKDSIVTISDAIGKTITLDEKMNGLMWEVKPRSAILYKICYNDDAVPLQAEYKEKIFEHSNSLVLLRSMIDANFEQFFLINNLNPWWDD